MDYETFPGSQLLIHLKNMRGELFAFGLQLDVKHLKQKKKHNIDLKTNHSFIQAMRAEAIFNVHE